MIISNDETDFNALVEETDIIDYLCSNFNLIASVLQASRDEDLLFCRYFAIENLWVLANIFTIDEN